MFYIKDKEIGLFGSFSDNSFSENSDIDILVNLERPIGWNFFSLEIYLLYNKIYLVDNDSQYFHDVTRRSQEVTRKFHPLS
ncbi:MAG: nucleotidyltransferase domain-containing protein [Bacteroidetes bacterium]|nr:nucleotidyltransferase domain-containing protein [Bacteroidota bacterium]